MKETCEFRIDEDFAPKLFADDEGKRLGDSVRKVEISTDDTRFCSIGQLQEEVQKKTDCSFFYGWILRRHYSKKELDAASLFQLLITSTFEPAGEECGTEYDESTACPSCGAGARQITPLFMNVKRIPKSKDVSRTIAGENVVSRRVAELFSRHKISGAGLLPVKPSKKSSAESRDWFQLTVPMADAEIVAPTRVGINPFDDDEKGECRCPVGDMIGLNLLSEVSIKSTTRGDDDIISTRQFVGTRRGLLQPERIILVSPKVRQVFESERLKGVKFEVAHLV